MAPFAARHAFDVQPDGRSTASEVGRIELYTPVNPQGQRCTRLSAGPRKLTSPALPVNPTPDSRTGPSCCRPVHAVRVCDHKPCHLGTVASCHSPAVLLNEDGLGSSDLTLAVPPSASSSESDQSRTSLLRCLIEGKASPPSVRSQQNFKDLLSDSIDIVIGEIARTSPASDLPIHFTWPRVSNRLQMPSLRVLERGGAARDNTLDPLRLDNDTPFLSAIYITIDHHPRRLANAVSWRDTAGSWASCRARSFARRSVLGLHCESDARSAVDVQDRK